MNNAHEADRALTPAGRTKAPCPGGGSRTRLTRAHAGRGRRGFSMVELVVAFTIFIVLASFIALALARSFSSASASHEQSHAAAALSDELDKVADIGYDQLVAGTFTVPDACADSGRGITGTSCVGSGTTALKIAYGFGTGTGGQTCSGGQPDTTAGYLTVNGCVVATGRTAFTGTGDVTNTPAAIQSRQVNPDRPGFAAGAGTVRVQLSGDYTALPGSTILLIHPAPTDPASGQPGATTQVASGTVDESGTALIAVDGNGTTTACAPADPCALALDTDTTPTQVTSGNTTLTMTGTDAGPDGALVVPAGAITDVTADIEPAGAATLAIVATKDKVRAPNPDPGSVCVWVTFPTGTGTRTVPACNTADAGSITLDTYDPNWASVPVGTPDIAAVRYPYPTGTPLRLSVDDPDGTCPSAPGLVASQPAAAGGWEPAAVCSSFTWGMPSHLEVTDTSGVTTKTALTAATITLQPGTTTTAALVWDNPLLAAPAVGYGDDQPWGKPRTELGCSADSSCTSAASGLAAQVPDPATGYPSATYPNQACLTDDTCRQQVARIAPEPLECPSQYCYSTNNEAPYLTAGTATHIVETGSTTTFTLNVRDTDDPAATVTATVAATPDGTALTFGQPTTVDGHERTYTATFTDTSGTSDAKDITLILSGGTGDRAQTTTVHLTASPPS